MDPLRTAHALADAAFQAWHAVASRSDLHVEVGMGADGTPTSVADAALEGAIVVAARAAGVNVVSEEAGVVDHGSAWTAVIDPLDGSRNAGRGLPLFCTSVAVGRGRSMADLEAGVVKNLVSGDVYAAARGRGATVNGKPVQRRTFDPHEVMVAVIADYEDSAAVERMQRKHHHIRDLGSAALELCYVATGALDAFDARRDWLRVVDVAAGAVIVREAGGFVLDPRTWRDLDMAFDVRLRSGVVAAHSREALEAVR